MDAEPRGSTLTRDQREWLAWEDARLFDCALGMQYLSAQDLAVELSRDPLLILHRVLYSEVSDMVGFEAPRGSEEESEFLALGLAGAPLELALRWCTDCEGDERVDWDEVAMYLTADLRPATSLVRELGLWFTRADQLADLGYLVGQPRLSVAEAVETVLTRCDAPTPTVIARHLRGLGAAEPPVDWTMLANAAVAERCTSRRAGGMRRYGTGRRSPRFRRRVAT